eukprot:391224-Amphidinium_carterae.1
MRVSSAKPQAPDDLQEPIKVQQTLCKWGKACEACLQFLSRSFAHLLRCGLTAGISQDVANCS